MVAGQTVTLEVVPRFSFYPRKADISRTSRDVCYVPCVDGSALARRIFTLQASSVQPCVRPLGAVRMTAGHNALRGSGPSQKPAFDDAMAQVGCPDRRIDRLCITRSPCLLILPSLSFPPLEFCLGTSPIQAEKSRPVGEAFITHNDLLSCVGDGTALEEVQRLMYHPGGSQERVERGSQSPRATSKSAAKGLPMPYAAHCESVR
jgi:hypothetical protein